MRVVFGLGNPGSQYEETRHNVGFMSVQRLASTYGCQISNFRFRSLTGKAIIGKEQVILAKPQTFMNCCGPAFKGLLDGCLVAKEEVLVISDDFNLDFGAIRIRQKGSSGGHRGLMSIANAIGSTEFPRVRIGIGSFGRKAPPDFVLKKFSKSELKEMGVVMDRVALAIELWINSGIEAAMNRFN